MSIAIAPPAEQTRPTAAPGVAVSLSILLVGTAWHATGYGNTDIAWLLTVGERVLDGAVPYRDIIETNPPGSVLLYMPAVLVGRALGVDPQVVAMLLTGLACAASLALCGAVLRSALPPATRGPLLAVATAALVLLPAGSFGQREHVILLASLPLLCRLALRGGGHGPTSRPLGLLVGAAAGISLAVKPYYALGFVGPALVVWRRAGWRGLASAPEIRSAAAVAALLLGAQLLLFPAFTRDVLPLLTRVYLPMRLPAPMLLRLPGGAAALAVLLATALARGRPGAPVDRSVADTAWLAAVGFFAAYLVQGKGWPYHAYPCIAVGLIGLGVSVATRTGGAAAARIWAGRIVSVALAGWAAVALDEHMDIDVEAPGLVGAVAGVGPHPRVMSLAPDIAVGHPLVRRVDGLWVGTLMSSWIDLYVGRIAGGRDRDGPYGAELAFEDRTMASDIRGRRPDAVLASAGADWIAGAPEVAAALADYRPAGTYGSVTLWTRKLR